MELFRAGGASWDHVFGVAVYGDHSDKLWFKLTIRPIYRALRAVDKTKWWLAYRLCPEHRYHVIDTRLPPKYYDIDHLMLHGMFSLLRRYVEDELGGREKLVGKVDWLKDAAANQDEDDYTPEGLYAAHAERENDVVKLYDWWMVERPADLAKRDELMGLLYGGDDRITWTDLGNGLREAHCREDVGNEKIWRRALKVVEEKIEREEQEMLHKLVDMRRSLWT
jgi:hypothetical protein